MLHAHALGLLARDDSGDLVEDRRPCLLDRVDRECGLGTRPSLRVQQSVVERNLEDGEIEELEHLVPVLVPVLLNHRSDAWQVQVGLRDDDHLSDTCRRKLFLGRFPETLGVQVAAVEVHVDRSIDTDTHLVQRLRDLPLRDDDRRAVAEVDEVDCIRNHLRQCDVAGVWLLVPKAERETHNTNVHVHVLIHLSVV